jgi:hypothetical protein
VINGKEYHFMGLRQSAEYQHLAGEAANASFPYVYYRSHLTPNETCRCVVHSQLCARAAQAQFGAEVDE